MAAATKKKKEEAYPWKAGASSRHITNLKQSILETFNIYGVIQPKVAKASMEGAILLMFLPTNVANVHEP
jgi:hypothetical protein